MDFDILCLLLGLRLSLLLGLVCAYGNGIVLFLTEDIGKERSCEMGLVILLVIGQPHTLPLLWADLTGLYSLAVNGRHTQDDTGLVLGGLGLEDIHTLDFSQFLCRSLALKEIDFQFRLFIGHDIVFGGHVLAHTFTGFVVTLLDGNEELVHIILTGIDGESFLILRLDVHGPLAFVILQHEHLVKVNGTRAFHRISNIKSRDVFQLPFVELGNADLLAVEVTVIGSESQRTISVVELDGLKAFLLKGMVDTFLVHAGNLVVNG